MITKNQLKYIKSLHSKKHRHECKTFLVEGGKSLIELLQTYSFKIEILCVTQKFYNEYKDIIKKRQELSSDILIEILEIDEITKLSTLETNSDGIAVVYQKPNLALQNENEYILVLDEIKDPGNLGTIIRIADWYGIKKIICSYHTVELYNPKVIISSMGSFTRVQIFYTDIYEYLSKQTLPIYGTFIAGDNIHTTLFSSSGFIVIGSESNGISKEVEKCVTTKITIPKIGLAESLNAAVATAITVDNVLGKRI